MAPYWSQQFANPSQRGHRPGLTAAVAVDQARQTVADALGVTPSQVIFTSGATEANNLAIWYIGLIHHCSWHDARFHD